MNTSTQPRYAKVYDIPERPRAPPVPKVSPLRYEDRSTNSVSHADEEHCLIGYGEISISDCYGVGKDEQERRVPRLKHTRPPSRHQTQATRTDSVHVSTRDPNGRGDSPLTEGVGQSEPEYFKHIFKATSTDRPANPETDFRTFFEKLRNAPEMKRKRSMLLRNSPASEAVDARPRLN